MVTGVPIYAIVLDYILGMVMWTLVGRFGMRLFLPEDSRFFFSRFFIRVTDPLIRLFKRLCATTCVASAKLACSVKGNRRTECLRIGSSSAKT